MAWTPNKHELETKKLSQLGFMDYFELKLILCNDIANQFDLIPLNFEYIFTDSEGGGDDFDPYEIEIFQYFLFDIDRLEDVQYMKEPIFYCEELDLGVLGFTNLGTHRSMIFTDIPLKKDARGLYWPEINRDETYTNQP